MEIIIGKYSGFCGGVKLAIQKAEEALANVTKAEPIYCLGEIVHNSQVIEKLEMKGLKIVNSIAEVQNGAKMIVRAHGEPEDIYIIAKEKKIEIIDTTCGNVKVIHDKVKNKSKDSFIIIIGDKNHAETLGTIGFAGDNYYVVENENDILDSYIEYEKTNLEKVYVVSQTTFPTKKFHELEEEIYTNFIEADVVVDNTICNATEIRENECEKISEKVDCMIIIGGKNSANTKKLFEIASSKCNEVYWVQTVNDIQNKNFDKIDKIGIMAGASTPDYIVEEVTNFLDKRYNNMV